MGNPLPVLSSAAAASESREGGWPPRRVGTCCWRDARGLRSLLNAMVALADAIRRMPEPAELGAMPPWRTSIDPPLPTLWPEALPAAESLGSRRGVVALCMAAECVRAALLSYRSSVMARISLARHRGLDTDDVEYAEEYGDILDEDAMQFLRGRTHDLLLVDRYRDAWCVVSHAADGVRAVLSSLQRHVTVDRDV